MVASVLRARAARQPGRALAGWASSHRMRASAPLSKGRTPGAPRAPRFGLDHALARRAVRLVGAAFLPLRRPPVVVGWPRDYNRSRREQVRPMERRISMPLGVVVER